MGRSDNQKLKLLRIRDILLSETDEEHSLSAQDIIDRLEEYGIKAERKAIYSDIEALCDYGMDIICERGRCNRYSVGSRDFEIAELRLLSDAVCASRFISEKKSSQLIKSIEKLAGSYEARSLDRQVFIEKRVKTQNESIYYNIDAIHRALSENRKITFYYYKYGVTKQKEYREGKSLYTCSPYGLIFNDENYYLAAYYDKYGKVVPFRVDRMESITVTEEGCSEAGKPFSIAEYCRENFSMFGGKTEFVTLRFDNSLSDVVFDRFGMDTAVSAVGRDTFSVRVKVSVSPQFMGWLAGLGGKVEILSPESTGKAYADYLKEILELYQK